MAGSVIELTDATFDKTVHNSDVPVLVDFWAPWCGPCKMVAPILEKIAKEFTGKVIVAKVNTDDHSEWANKYGVQGIPTMLFMAEGKVVHQQVGALPEPMLRTILDQFLEVVNEEK
jgi:thioredoxin 1